MQDITDNTKSSKSKWSGPVLVPMLVDICTSSGHVMSKMAKMS